MKKLLFMCMAAALTPPFAEGFAQNPIIQTRFTADPAPYVLGDTCYLYTSVDNEEGEGYQKTFWQLYTSTDMVNWTDRGTVASLADFSWAGDNGAWAPHAISRSGKWFLYVPIQLRGIGVLMGNSPTGPWRDVRKGPLINQDIRDIDPTVFIDKDEQAYLYWGNNGLWYARLSRNMMAINGDYVEIPRTVESVGGYEETYVDENGQEQTRLVGTDKYEEGPWVYERNGKYYLIYAAGGIPEHLSYSMSDSPTGPWKYCGQIMDPPEGSFTTHPGIVDFKGRSFIFYHNGGLKGGSGFRRSVCVEEFKYNADGTIPHIPATKTGVTEAVTHLSPYIRQEAETIGMSLGVRTAQDETHGVYLDSLDMSDYVKVKSVDFGTTGARSVLMAVRKVHASGFIQVCIDTQSNIVGTVNVPESGEWTEVRADLDQPVTGIHDIYFRFRATDTSNRKNLMQFDYWQFFTNTTTDIASTQSETRAQEDGATYDLSGRKVEQPGKGVYIRDGKKFLNRP